MDDKGLIEAEAAYPEARVLRERVSSGAMKAVDVAEIYIGQIAAQDKEIKAFAWHDPEYVRAQAQALDTYRQTGRKLGPLHGIPVAIKDIVDTAKIPTENGSKLDAGRVPDQDAFIVSKLKQAGAMILGKTVTTELAFMDPAATRNPHNKNHTPGGSSAGSAAAVAAGMAPLAIGTQTAGSVIRPASFCGVVGYKPSFGAIPRTGILAQAPSLDTVGVFATSVADAALLGEALMGFDPADPATSAGPVPNLFEVASSAPPVTPALAFVRQPAWGDAEAEMQEGFAELIQALGDAVEEIQLPQAFAEALAGQKTIQIAELAKCFYGYARRGADQLGPNLRDGIEAGNKVMARDYIAALDWRQILSPMLAKIFARFDAIVTPAAPGPAPEGLGATGSPAFNSLWTLCGTPAVTIPALEASNGLPMGVQLVGRHGDDARLLRTANWLAQHLAEKRN